jgi:hypothetical protein
MEIDNRGERLMGCLTCNLWAVLIVRGGQGLAKRTSAPSISYASAIASIANAESKRFMISLPIILIHRE